jgi:hypothetical protein
MAKEGKIMKFEYLSDKNQLIIWWLLQYFICPFVGHKQDEWNDEWCARCYKSEVWEFEADNG